jgi:hypothetical protein
MENFEQHMFINEANQDFDFFQLNPPDLHVHSTRNSLQLKDKCLTSLQTAIKELRSFAKACGYDVSGKDIRFVSTEIFLLRFSHGLYMRNGKMSSASQIRKAKVEDLSHGYKEWIEMDGIDKAKEFFHQHFHEVSPKLNGRFSFLGNDRSFISHYL